MAKRKKKIHKRELRLYGVALSALIVGIVLFVLAVQLKAMHEKQDRDRLAREFISEYYKPEEFLRPTFLPTPTNAPVPVTGPVKIPIIMYHYVEYVQDQNDTTRKRLDVTPNVFEQHLKSFREAHYETYFMQEVPDLISGKIQSQPDKSVVLTFDDGYEDFYTNVFPLLKKYHMRATLYVIYDFIGRRGFVTKEQVQELIDSNLVEIGSHTFDHLYLKSVSDVVAKKQIIDSKKAFEDEFHTKIYTFAYPYGAMSPQAIQDTKDAGYTAAVSVIPGVMQSKDNLYFLSRIRPGVFGASPAETLKHLQK